MVTKGKSGESDQESDGVRESNDVSARKRKRKRNGQCERIGSKLGRGCNPQGLPAIKIIDGQVVFPCHWKPVQSWNNGDVKTRSRQQMNKDVRSEPRLALGTATDHIH